MFEKIKEILKGNKILSKKDAQLTILNNELAESEMAYKHLQEKYEALKARNVNLEYALNDQKEINEQLAERLAGVRENVNSIRSKKNHENKVLTSIAEGQQKGINKLREENARLKEQIEQMKLDEEITKHNNKLEGKKLKDYIDVLNGLEEVPQNVKEKDVALAYTDKELLEQKELNAQMEDEIISLHNKVASADMDKLSLEDEIQNKKNIITSKNKTINNLREKVSGYKQEVENKDEKIANFVTTMKQELAKLEDDREM